MWGGGGSRTNEDDTKKIKERKKYTQGTTADRCLGPTRALPLSCLGTVCRDKAREQYNLK